MKVALKDLLETFDPVIEGTPVTRIEPGVLATRCRAHGPFDIFFPHQDVEVEKGNCTARGYYEGAEILARDFLRHFRVSHAITQQDIQSAINCTKEENLTKKV